MRKGRIVSSAMSMLLIVTLVALQALNPQYAMATEADGGTILTGIAGAGNVNTGTLNVTGATTTAGITNTGNVGTTTLSTTGAATVGTTLGVTGATTLFNTLDAQGVISNSIGNVMITDSTTIQSAAAGNSRSIITANSAQASVVFVDATGDNHGLTVGPTSTTLSGGTNSSMWTLADGDAGGATLTVSGSGGGTTHTLFNASTNATGTTSAVTIGTAGNTVNTIQGSTNTITGTTNINTTGIAATNIGNTTGTVGITGSTNTITGTTSVNIVADSNVIPADGRGAVNVTETTASLTVTNALGNTHGITVGTANTVISGGTNSTTLTLNDSGATFADTTTGGPARVTGVADGANPYDAVNFRQLKDVKETAYSGIASVAALAAMPDPIQGNKFSMGLGYGHYEGQDAVAIGFKGVVMKNVIATVGVGYSGSNTTTNAGLGFSW